MRKVVSAALVVLALSWVTIAIAADETVTLDGNIVCAKCTLKVPGVEKCQTVLLVKTEGGEETQYWLAKNSVADAFGEVCEEVKPTRVTGTIEARDGKKWIAATKIEPR